MTRGRKPAIEPSISTNVAIPEGLRVRLDLLLYSEVEGRVPKGAYQRFFSERLVEYFNQRQLDLSPFLGTLPGERVVRADITTAAALEQLLKAKA